MELKIKEPSFPEVIEFNYEEIKNELTEKVEHYKTLVYTDVQIKEAKTDLARLRKFVKVLNDKRIEVKKDCLKPYEKFEKLMRELEAVVNEPIFLIDKQVKEYEAERKEKKLNDIIELINSMNPPKWLDIAMIMEPNWTNASMSLTVIKKMVEETLKRIENESKMIEELPEYSFEAMSNYKSSLSLTSALSTAKACADMARAKEEFEAKRKAEAERMAAEKAAAEARNEEQIEQEVRANINPPIEEAKATARWCTFKALMTVEQAFALRTFCKANGIDIRSAN